MINADEFDDVLSKIDEDIKSKKLTASEQFLNELEESHQLWEMSNRRKNQTGLPMNIYILMKMVHTEKAVMVKE